MERRTERGAHRDADRLAARPRQTGGASRRPARPASARPPGPAELRRATALANRMLAYVSARGPRLPRSAAGHFNDDSMLRRVQRERVMALGPACALLMARTCWRCPGCRTPPRLEDPYDGLARTAEVMSTIGFGFEGRRRPDDASRAGDAPRAGSPEAAGWPHSGGHALPGRRPGAPDGCCSRLRGLRARRLPDLRGARCRARRRPSTGALQAGRAPVRAAAARHAAYARRPRRLPARDARWRPAVRN